MSENSRLQCSAYTSDNVDEALPALPATHMTRHCQSNGVFSRASVPLNGNPRKYPVERHAHWDCSNPGAVVSSSSMLAACLSAASLLQGCDGLGPNIGEPDGTPISVIHSLQEQIRLAVPQEELGNFSLVARLNKAAENRSRGLVVGWAIGPTNESSNDADTQASSSDLITTCSACELCQKSNFPKWVKETSKRVLEELIRASRSPKPTLRKDDLLSMVGVLLLCHSWNVQAVSCSPLPANGACPETLHLLLGMPIMCGDGVARGGNSRSASDHSKRSNNNRGSWVTPCAVAILKVLMQMNNNCSNITETTSIKSPPMTLRATGFGNHLLTSDVNSPSSIQFVLGDPIRSTPPPQPPCVSLESHLWKVDRLMHMEANLDDTTAECLAFAVELLMKHGAVDAWVTPIVMKKGRPAHTLHCLCHHPACQNNRNDYNVEDEDSTWRNLVTLLFQQTSTLGVRIHKDLERLALHRSILTVQTPFTNTTRQGQVAVKIGYLGDETIVSVKAEFDHCKDISLETGIPLQQIATMAVQLARDTLNMH